MDKCTTTKLALQIAKELHTSLPKQATGIFQSVDETRVIDRKDIYTALQKVAPSLANSYAQVKMDLQDPNRLSWAGTSHEIREIISNLLRTLAPDNIVTSQKWYTPEQGASKPTQKQRVRHILQTRGKNSTKCEVVEKIGTLDELVAELVRSTYSRASNAAHTFEPRQETLRILGYFEAFAQDLLELE